MVAQIVFNLPLDGPFDYWIPEALVSQVKVGMRVKVSFGPRAQIGFVTGLLDQSDIVKLKPILSVSDPSPLFNSLDLAFARDFSAYYGCSLGEALATMLRNKAELKPSVHRSYTPQISLYTCMPHSYAERIQKIIDAYPGGTHFLILIPDAFRAQALSLKFKSIKFGTRSCVFESDARFDCVVMIDDEYFSYKQEQTPMYDTREVLISRSKIFGFDVAFLGVSPSVELMGLVREGRVRLIENAGAGEPTARIIDLTNYKFVPGLIAPPLRDALEKTLKAGKRSILVLNSRGSYRLTRCVDCGEILKCTHCDSSLIYSRIEGKFLCRHCTYTASGDTVCPKCHKPSWKSIGIGVEQLQTEVKKLFEQARIQSFERAKQESLSDFDILISTSAVLRFQDTLKVAVVGFIDFDAQLNRLDMRSAFNAFSLALHIGSMAVETIFIQTRNSSHYVLQYLSRGQIQEYYDEELKLRKEFGFSPFKHWIKISWRGKVEKSTHENAQRVYNELSNVASANLAVMPPLADAVGRKRDQFRFNVMMQTGQVSATVALVKSTLARIRRPSRVIVTINVDP